MKSYMKYVKNHLTLVKLTAILAKLPSRKTEFSNFLTRLTGLPPNTVKMILCSTTSGATLLLHLKQKETKAIGVLWKLSSLLIVSLRALWFHSILNYLILEYKELIEDIGSRTEASRPAVISWIYGRHYPRSYSQLAIAELLEQPVSSLFPKRNDPRK